MPRYWDVVEGLHFYIQDSGGETALAYIGLLENLKKARKDLELKIKSS